MAPHEGLATTLAQAHAEFEPGGSPVPQVPALLAPLTTPPGAEVGFAPGVGVPLC